MFFKSKEDKDKRWKNLYRFSRRSHVVPVPDYPKPKDAPPSRRKK